MSVSFLRPELSPWLVAMGLISPFFSLIRMCSHWYLATKIHSCFSAIFCAVQNMVIASHRVLWCSFNVLTFARCYSDLLYLTISYLDYLFVADFGTSVGW